MNEYNDGISEANILQNQFTAYLMTAVHRRKLQYLQDNARKQKYELPLDSFQELEGSDLNRDMANRLPVIQQFENVKLHKALSGARERELKILYMKVLEDKSFVEIAEEIGIGYNAVKASYYRLIEKIKAQLGGERK